MTQDEILRDHPDGHPYVAQLLALFKGEWSRVEEFSKRFPLYWKYIVLPGRKDPLANVRYRKALLRWARKSPENKTAIKIACKRDLLFYVNAFAMCIEPRPNKADPEKSKRFCFISRPKQDDVIFTMAPVLGFEDIYIEKSRDEGATWCIIQLFAWRVQFYFDEMYLMISRREEDVYKKGVPKALFSKLEYLLKNQPKWLGPMYLMKKLACEFPETGGVINGEATNEFAGSGDRVKACLLDEFAKVKYDDANAIWQSTDAMTDCRIVNSTHLDEKTKFCEIRKDVKTRILMGWWDNPAKNKGLYRTPDGKLRSPWYDAKCERLGNSTAIKQELDVDPIGSDQVFFEELKLRPMRDKNAVPPLRRGRLDYALPSYKFRQFVDDSNGPLSIWFALDKNGKPPRGIKLHFGGDLSRGTGASNSSLSGRNPLYGEQLVSYTRSDHTPYEIAEDFHAIWHWLCDNDDSSGLPWNPTPLLVWEIPGPGQEFGKKVQELGFTNVWYRPKSEWDTELTIKTGWTSGAASKVTLLEEYRYAVQSGKCLVRDLEIYGECLYFKYVSDTVEHSGARHGDDSGARANHGDRVVADALSWWITKDVGKVEVQEAEKTPENCIAARMAAARLEEASVGEYGKW